MLLVLIPTLFLAALLPAAYSTDSGSEYVEVDVVYLVVHAAEYEGETIRTRGMVCYVASFYMYEDFWLSRAIPVVVRFAGLQKPPANSSIEICGVVEYCVLEGGFYYLNAQSWTYSGNHLPEFAPLAVVILLTAVTLLMVTIHRRRQRGTIRATSSARAEV